MADDAGTWAGLAQWALANPEKIALALVVVAGAWRWIRELIHEARGDSHAETFMEALLRERRELIQENRELRAELKASRRHDDRIPHDDPPA